MRIMLGWGALGLTLAVLHHILPGVDEVLGGSWWWWLMVAAVIVFAVWRDLQSRRKRPEN